MGYGDNHGDKRGGSRGGGSGSYSSKFGGGGWSGMREYMRVKNVKIQQQLEETTDVISDIFHNCYFFIDGRTHAASDVELKKLVVQYGGKYEAYGRRVTHMIADNIAEGNQTWRNIRDRQKFETRVVVTSQWVLDCIAANRRIKESNYLPSVLRDTNYRHGGLSNYLKDGPVDEKEENDDSVEGLVTEEDDDTVVDCYHPDFVTSYYSKSRLHLLGSFKQHILSDRIRYPFIPLLTLMSAHVGEPFDPFSGGSKSQIVSYMNTKDYEGGNHDMREETQTTILFVDYDAFFVEASRQRTSLSNEVPIGVAHSNGDKSELASVNYAARLAGVRKGMWVKTAKLLSPELEVVRYDFDNIKRCSCILYDGLFLISPRILVGSIDEGFVQIVGLREIESIVVIATWLREEVTRRTGGLTVSVGIGYNKLMAKLAGDLSKPTKGRCSSPSQIPSLSWLSTFGSGISMIPPYVIGPASVEKGLPSLLQASLHKLDDKVLARFPSSFKDQLGPRECLYSIHPNSILARYAIGMVLGPLETGSLQSIGPKVETDLASLGISAIRDLYDLSISPMSPSLYQKSTPLSNRQLLRYLAAFWPYEDFGDEGKKGRWNENSKRLMNIVGKELTRKLIMGSLGIDVLNNVTLPGTGENHDFDVNLNYGIRIKEGDLEQVDRLIEQLHKETERRMALRNLLGCHVFKMTFLIRLPGAPKDPGKYGACGRCYSSSLSEQLSSNLWSHQAVFVTKMSRELMRRGGLSEEEVAKVKEMGCERFDYWSTLPKIRTRIGSANQGGTIEPADIRGIQFHLIKVVPTVSMDPILPKYLSIIAKVDDLSRPSGSGFDSRPCHDQHLNAFGFERRRGRAFVETRCKVHFSKVFEKRSTIKSQFDLSLTPTSILCSVSESPTSGPGHLNDGYCLKYWHLVRLIAMRLKGPSSTNGIELMDPMYIEIKKVFGNQPLRKFSREWLLFFHPRPNSLESVFCLFLNWLRSVFSNKEVVDEDVLTKISRRNIEIRDLLCLNDETVQTFMHWFLFWLFVEYQKPVPFEVPLCSIEYLLPSFSHDPSSVVLEQLSPLLAMSVIVMMMADEERGEPQGHDTLSELALIMISCITLEMTIGSFKSVINGDAISTALSPLMPSVLLGSYLDFIFPTSLKFMSSMMDRLAALEALSEPHCQWDATTYTTLIYGLISYDHSLFDIKSVVRGSLSVVRETDTVSSSLMTSVHWICLYYRFLYS